MDTFVAETQVAEALEFDCRVCSQVTSDLLSKLVLITPADVAGIIGFDKRDNQEACTDCRVDEKNY